MYFAGLSVEKDNQKALKWLQSTSDDIDAQWVTGLIYYIGGHGVEKNIDKGLEWIQLAAKNNSVEAQEFLDILALVGKYNQKNN